MMVVVWLILEAVGVGLSIPFFIIGFIYSFVKQGIDDGMAFEGHARRIIRGRLCLPRYKRPLR